MTLLSQTTIGHSNHPATVTELPVGMFDTVVQMCCVKTQFFV